MTRSPLQPTPAATPIGPVFVATSAAAPASPTAATPRVSNVTVAQGSSPLKRQERDLRGQPDYKPCNLIFLNGPYEGQTVDLGLAVNSVSAGNQTAEWQDQDGKGIRPGINFDRLSNREFQVSLEFWSLSEDVFHLVENLATAQEIGNGEKQPPFLLFQMGSAVIAPVVCTSYSPTLSEPHPGRKGFRHGTCELSFKLAGGKDSEHALGKPLTSTPLGDARTNQTVLERQKQAQRQITQLLLAPCIGEKGSAALTDMVEQNKLSDPSAIARLSPATLAQAAIAGIIPADALKNESIAPLVRAAIASEMAAREPGFRSFARQVAQGWLNGGTFSGVRNAAVLEQARSLQKEFDAIAAAVISQSLTKVLESGNTAGERLRQFGACGLRLRNSGSVDIRSPKDEAGTLTKLNEAIASATDDEALKQRFGITTAEEVSALRNGAPYQSRQELITHMSSSASVDGMALWSRFETVVAQEATDKGKG